ncbi:MAG TPA: FAD-binding oxidoreductase [Bryobacteraceae bacterium]|nr:FAD-binding oxidoreductase [Bryobacteraceae bacterium]HOL70102.1 FAD-binding oxidoreductase [Bryobacteraceae bacterium]HOQ43828.1 FAD-binding oxidoreductase [Bryobacteraceae bacterium]HPQ14702.1 FAD-binding oxidoreductase [Bryobacteraceae bacterium]HPU71729.1 FAD-binding oxidoreductase [Bryobacteraceae bacterium]
MTDSKHIAAVITSRRDVTPELWIVRVRPEEPIQFVPGQYVTIGLPGEGRLIERPYSVVSSPREPELEFFVELVPGGHLTPHLYNVPVGASGLTIRRAAKGRFLFDDRSGRTCHFMVATVTGVAPFVSMMREFAARVEEGEPWPHRIALVHGASVSRELAYCEELSEYDRRFEWFRYIPTISRTWLDPGWRGELGRAEDIVRKHLDALGFTPSGTTAYACGNPNMIENVKGVFQRAGYPKESFKQEVYW